jgi:ATP-dependent DNA helicase RecG
VNILVSTTVVEVGVDVPNASVMVIEHAERFGLSQLHQLRGRIGRGAAKSHCVLVGPTRMTEEAKARLEAMVRTSNGFEIAETDLELRGPGEFFGTRQSGSLGFQIANPMRDRAVLDLARKEAFALVEAATPSSAADKPAGETAKPAASSAASAGVNELDRLLRRLPAEWQRRYHLARIG